MPQLKAAREGQLLDIKGRPVSFTLWPVVKGTRRHGLHSRVFTSNPWFVIRDSINKRCPSGARPQAIAFSQQAEDYFRSATLSGITAAKPVLIYYCFLNLVKSYILTQDNCTDLSSGQHGLSERLPTGGRELIDAYLDTYPSTTTKINIFDLFYQTLLGAGIGTQQRFEITDLLAQCLYGHKLWCVATDSTERFLRLDRIDFMKSASSKQIWINLRIYKDELTKNGFTHKKVLQETNLGTSFTERKDNSQQNQRELLLFEQNTPVDYTGYPADKLQELADTLRPYLWTTVLNSEPYRQYYVYLNPTTAPTLHQLLSMYALSYYLGSITRYRPNQFESIMSERYGAVVHEFVTRAPTQFIYLMTSLFAKQEVAVDGLV